MNYLQGLSVVCQNYYPIGSLGLRVVRGFMWAFKGNLLIYPICLSSSEMSIYLNHCFIAYIILRLILICLE